jgi:hypothetical protein
MAILDWVMVGFIVIVVIVSGVGVYKTLKD